jgi:hypothetical protein
MIKGIKIAERYGVMSTKCRIDELANSTMKAQPADADGL